MTTIKIIHFRKVVSTQIRYLHLAKVEHKLFTRQVVPRLFKCNPMWFKKSCLYEKNHPTQVRRFTWVTSRQNGVFHFVKTNLLYENAFIPPRWDLTSMQVRSHLSGMIFLHVNRLCRAVPPTQDCSFSLDLVCFYND